MKIVFQNAHFVAVDKASGVLTVPGRTAGDERPVLGRLLEKQLHQNIFPVHRLDAEVSGLVLYALTPEAHRDASIQFERRHVQKTYQAFSKGGDFSAGEKGEWTAKILRGKKRAFESPVGKLAITHYEVRSVDPTGVIEWRLFPLTGRSHQLRWELYRNQSPILGDALYGSPERWAEGVALRSLSLRFEASFNRNFALPDRLNVEAWRHWTRSF